MKAKSRARQSFASQLELLPRRRVGFAFRVRFRCFVRPRSSVPADAGDSRPRRRTVGVEGPEVLTASIPKQPDEIEALVGTAALNL